MAAISKTPQDRSFSVSFQLKTSIEGSHSHGEGFTFFFAKDASEYEQNSITWSSFGFMNDGKGYAIRFHDVLNQIALLNGNHEVIGDTESHTVFTNGQWVDIDIKVESERVTVKWNDVIVFEQQANFDFTYSHVGFGVGTGAYTSAFNVRNIVFTDL